MNPNNMSRLTPNLPAQAYKTYQIVSPKSSHFREGTCEEAECEAYQNGWRTVVDEMTDLGQRQAHYIRSTAGRKYLEEKVPQGTIFTFEAGQRCFRTHEIPLGRPAYYVVKGGDWRGNPLGTKTLRHEKPEHWVEDFSEHQDNLATQIQKG